MRLVLFIYLFLVIPLTLVQEQRSHLKKHHLNIVEILLKTSGDFSEKSVLPGTLCTSVLQDIILGIYEIE